MSRFVFEDYMEPNSIDNRAMMSYFPWDRRMTNSDTPMRNASETESAKGGGGGGSGLTDLSLGVCQQPPPADTKNAQQNQKEQKQILSELERHYDKNIRPLLDMVDRLRTLGITDEGIELPSIVVVGDQSSGKSSVLESLASINLPRGQGIATRVPLILRLQRCPSNETAAVTIEYGSVKKQIVEEDIKPAVEKATAYLAGDGKGVTDAPICLHIRKPTAPDLTMIDLPGITRVPVLGQPEDIYEQISAMIRYYIQPKECVILNVLSATVDFSTCESIRMSQKEDREGQRTLAVVTKVDMSPDGLYEKVTMDAVNIGLGYICVRNRADGGESHEEAREKERRLFESHPALSKFDKDIVGISALAERLTIIQANIIRQSLPGIVRKIEKALQEKRAELQSMPEGVTDEVGAETAFLRILMENRTVLERLVVQGNFQGYSDDLRMHYTARLYEFFRTFSDVLHASGSGLRTKDKTKEILKLMAEGSGVFLPNFLNTSVFHGLVIQQIDGIASYCQQLVNTVYQYVQEVVFTVIDQHAGAFTNMKSAYRRSAMSVLGKTRDECIAFVNRELEKERTIVHTANDYYMENVNKIREHINRDKNVASQATPFGVNSGSVPQSTFIRDKSAASQSTPFGVNSGSVPQSTSFGLTSVPGPLPTPPFGFSSVPNSQAPLQFNTGSVAGSAVGSAVGRASVRIHPVNPFVHKNSNTESEYALEDDPSEQKMVSSNGEISSASNDYQSATEMRTSLVAYWKVVHKRLVDGITLELKYAFQIAILKLLDKNVLKEKASKGASYLLNEGQALSKKRTRLKQSVHVLQESYSLVSDLLKW